MEITREGRLQTRRLSFYLVSLGLMSKWPRMSPLNVKELRHYKIKTLKIIDLQPYQVIDELDYCKLCSWREFPFCPPPKSLIFWLHTSTQQLILWSFTTSDKPKGLSSLFVNCFGSVPAQQHAGEITVVSFIVFLLTSCPQRK